MRSKILYTLIFLLAPVLSLLAQFNNEWIDYNKTYYKFKLETEGIYRISQATLSANGLGTTSAEHFQLWKNGQQVPIYTSSPAGPLGTNGYIEFYGTPNDGRLDASLFEKNTDHIDEARSLFTDSASYFLTVNSSASNQRIVTQNNSASGSSLVPIPNIRKVARYNYQGIYDNKWTNYVHRGSYDLSAEAPVWSSKFTAGEMLSSNEFYQPGAGASYSNSAAVFQNLYVYSSGQVTVKVAVAGAARHTRNYSVHLNDTKIWDQSLEGFSLRYDSLSNISPALISGNTLTVNITKQPNGIAQDRMVAGFVVLDYPRQPTAGGEGYLTFYLPATNETQLVKINDVPANGNPVYLYDMASQTRMEGLINQDGSASFSLNPSTVTRNYVLFVNNDSRVQQVAAMQKRQFSNYSLSANQAAYVIISHPKFMEGSGNQVEAYRQYRASAAGGSHNAKAYAIDQLEDQFAYGIKGHPLSVKKFLSFARKNFSVFPKYCFLMGKGVNYNEYRALEKHVDANVLQLVPTFGEPGSDVMLATDDLTTKNYQTFIGRLSIIHSDEIASYLEKVKIYEANQANTAQSQEDKAWMKNVIHVVGANDPGLENTLTNYMGRYERVIEDTLFGANVTTFNKSNKATGTVISDELLKSKFREGISLLTYFGHSSATILDYNLDDPDQYDNPNKFPVFLLNGCNAGNFFSFDTVRLHYLNTISEKYILAENKGAIAMIASTHLGVVSGLHEYTTGFYQSVAWKSYGQSIGKNMQDAINYQNQYGIWPYIVENHTMQQTLHGDPALKMNAFDKPDYSIEPANIEIRPNFLSIAETKFDARIYYYNIGKAVNDSIVVKVTRKYPASTSYPAGFTETVFEQKVKAPYYVDSLILSLPIVGSRDKGTNTLTVTLDLAGEVAELSETNNEAAKELFIYEDEIRPVYPYNYAIINKNSSKLYGSTSNPLSVPANYRMEMDTTALFNSAFRITRNINSAGGLIEFDPGISFEENKVYYWRLAIIKDNEQPRWNMSSFVYINGTNTGFMQGHLYQHTASLGRGIFMDSLTRQWAFSVRPLNVFVNHTVYPVTGTADSDFSVSIDNEMVISSACAGHSLLFNVFDGISFKPWLNSPGGLYNSAMNTCGNSRRLYNFEFSDLTRESRRNIVDFLDAIPNGNYIMVRKILDAPYADETFVDTWKSDEQAFGTGNTIYHKLKDAGFAEIDSFNRPRIFIFLYKKGDKGFTPVYRMSEGIYDRLQMNENIPVRDSVGYIQSPVFGPAKAWKDVRWDGRTVGTGGDRVSIDVVGIQADGNENRLYTLHQNQKTLSLSGVNAVQYPFIKLVMRNADSVNYTPHQLNWWQLYYTPVPEGALAPNVLLEMPDEILPGQPMRFRIAFKNISESAFDSLLVKGFIQDRNNVSHPFTLPRFKPLTPSDTITVTLNLDSKDYPGNNTLYLAVNPDNDQPEQYFFNNFLYKTFRVSDDNTDPVLDVTFDGIRIMDKDIVSAKPHIQIKLEDENRFLMLNNPEDILIKLRYPGENTYRQYLWNTDTLRFNPASAGADANIALVDFFPELNVDSKDGEYELIISAKDRTGNRAGDMDYKVSFQVYNKPMISNLLNYPNPFSTSTSFVFTLTGSKVPDEFKIQIFTVTGKIVREITRQELGNIHVGTNITDYKWDGTDMFGQPLANGVYLYRLVTSLDGNAIEKFRLSDRLDQNEADLTDQFFNRGYGKMVILR